MQSSHWEYLAYVLVGVGIALAVCGSVTFIYFREHYARHIEYSSYSIPLLISGTFILALGIVAFFRHRQKKRDESIPPPPPPPPPPLPPLQLVRSNRLCVPSARRVF
jgi:uncharacterized membrane protein YfcA